RRQQRGRSGAAGPAAVGPAAAGPAAAGAGPGRSGAAGPAAAGPERGRGGAGSSGAGLGRAGQRSAQALVYELGRGIFTSAPFEKGDFLVEYRGELITKQECERRQRVYHDHLKVLMFEFHFNGKLVDVDEDTSQRGCAATNCPSSSEDVEEMMAEGSPNKLAASSMNLPSPVLDPLGKVEKQQQFPKSSGDELLSDEDDLPHSEVDQISDDDEYMSDKDYVPNSDSHDDDDDDDSDASIHLMP
ncbi:putative N-lysine methyltransferase SETD8-like, partial [Scophthalmus maximus]